MANTETTNITEVERLVKRLKIDGYSMVSGMCNDDCIGSKCSLDGYEWEIRVYPARTVSTPDSKPWVALQLVLLSKARAPVVNANLGCMMVDPTGTYFPSAEERKLGVFRRPKDSTPFVYLVSADDMDKEYGKSYLRGDSLTVQCTITVLKELPTLPEKEVPVPSSNLHQNLGELLQSEMGADVTFLVCGDTFAAHKNIVAARSPVFKAEFFGEMKEKLSHYVDVEGIESSVFKVMLHFIYTDTVPELDHGLVTAMVQHLLAAADRYGLDRLKKTCENTLSSGLTVDTAATTLALAEQHNCSQLKASSIEFIVSTPAVLDAVLSTEGYKDLLTSCPSMLADLLKSARGRKN